MKLVLIFLISFLISSASFSQDYIPSKKNLKEREHFQDMKFGMFIHWGIYSILGDGEWVMHNEKIPYKSYKRLADFFNPQKFNAAEWVALAKNAGMKYITITARHHDGFSMFKSAASSYNIVDATPYKKDPLIELATECQKQGIELHFYYSLLDWGRPDYAFGSKIVNGTPEKGNWPSYIKFMEQQLTELITKYPAVKGIWFDGHWERTNVNWHYNEIYTLIHNLKNDILIGNNHHMAPISGEDFQMFEKDLPGENTAGFNKDSKVGDLPLETCETINNSWGFNIRDTNYKSVKQIIHYLVNASGRNANFLLNVGPMPNGKIQTEFIDTLLEVGKWMKKYGETIYGTRGDKFKPQPWGVVTSKEKIIYCHILEPVSQFIQLPIQSSVKSAMLLNSGTNLNFKMTNGNLIIDLPVLKPGEIDSIIEIRLG